MLRHCYIFNTLHLKIKLILFIVGIIFLFSCNNIFLNENTHKSNYISVANIKLLQQQIISVNNLLKTTQNLGNEVGCE